MQPTQDGNGQDAIIAALRTKLQSMEDRIAEDQKTVAALRLSITAFTTRKRIKYIKTPHATTITKPHPLGFGGMKAQAAVEALLRSNPNKRYRAGEVQKEVLAGGFVPTTQFVGSQIAGSLARAVQKGVAARVKEGGAYFYQFKEEGFPLIEGKNAASGQG